jgi:predicted dehydrogenase
MNANPVRLAVMGAGLIGRRHVEHVLAEPGATLHSIIDPSDEARAFAQNRGLRWHPDLRSALENDRPDGLIIATPNAMHVEHGLAAIAAGLPLLVEKPLATDILGAERLVSAAEKAGLPLAVGHHRRHNPLILKAKQLIEEGRLGRIVSVHGFFWLIKPDDYYEIAWRREAGAGPILINLIHDIDLLRFLCGEITDVRAMRSSIVRNFPVEETAVVMLRFASGALGTFNVSDTIVAPWSWEHASGENPAYPRTDESCYLIGGTEGSLTIPRLELWRNRDARGWHEPFATERHVAADRDPLGLQIAQFCRVIREGEAPMVPGREGLESLRVIEMIRRAALADDNRRDA